MLRAKKGSATFFLPLESLIFFGCMVQYDSRGTASGCDYKLFIALYSARRPGFKVYSWCRALEVWQIRLHAHDFRQDFTGRCSFFCVSVSG